MQISGTNDTPVATRQSTTATVAEDSSVLFNAANSNKITISDSDDFGSNETVTLSVAHGKLNLSQTTGLTVTGNSTGSITITGSLTNLNAAINGLKYTPTADYNGTDTLNIGRRRPGQHRHRRFQTGLDLGCHHGDAGQRPGVAVGDDGDAVVYNSTTPIAIGGPTISDTADSSQTYFVDKVSVTVDSKVGAVGTGSWPAR